MDLPLKSLSRTKAATSPLLLEIDLSHGLLSAVPQDPLTALRGRNTPRLSQVLAGLRLGAKDPEVGGVLIHVTANVGVAQAEALGLALREFAESGKPTIAWSETFGELGPGTIPYYLATFAKQIWLQPSGSVGLQGVALEVTTVRGVLDKIGAEPQFGQRHEYKTAAELFMAREVSEPNREMTQRLCDSVTEQVSSATAAARSLNADQVAEAIAASPLTAKEALERGLIDQLGYREDVYDRVRADLGGEIRLQFAHRYAKQQEAQPVRRLQQRKRPTIAVVSIDGGIVTGRSRGGSPIGGPNAGSDSVTAALRAVAEDEAVKAVVLRIDSPGGSYVASDAIRDAVLRLRRTGRPVIAAMGSVAASGGYFVAMPCDKIVALPSTLTGSIGVLGGKIVIAQTLERIGITREAIGSGSGATMFSSARHFDDAEWARVEAWLDLVYEDFTRKAAEDRHLPYEVLEGYARGRVWTGADAQERGLVDELGGVPAAIRLACEQAGLDRDEVRVAPFPHLPMLARLKPAESTASPVDAVAMAPARSLQTALTHALTGLHPGSGPASGSGTPGTPGTPGILTLPWHLTFR